MVTLAIVPLARHDAFVTESGSLYTKSRNPPGRGFFPAEAAGLAWLAVPGGPAVPRVHRVSEQAITVDRIPTGRPSVQAARKFGAALAQLHLAGAPSFGAPPPGAPDHGWIGDLPMAYGDFRDFPSFWANARLLPTAHAARRSGGLNNQNLADVEDFCAALAEGMVDPGPAVRPGRLHGDLWSGNALWGADGQVWLIDPAAHGGHPSSDLAMLALFGAPHLAEITAAHGEVSGIAPLGGSLLALHQMWPLLVHAALFGPAYGVQAMGALRLASRLRG